MGKLTVPPDTTPADPTTLTTGFNRRAVPNTGSSRQGMTSGLTGRESLFGRPQIQSSWALPFPNPEPESDWLQSGGYRSPGNDSVVEIDADGKPVIRVQLTQHDGAGQGGEG